MEYLVQGDAEIQYKVAYTRADGTAVSFTSSTVVMRFRKKGTTTVLSTLSNIATADQKANGICVFEFASGDLNVAVGEYEGEIEVTTGTKIETDYEIKEFYIRADMD